MKRLLFVLALLVASNAQASMLTGSSHASCGRQLQLPVLGAYVPSDTLGTQTVSGTAGLIRCANFTPTCDQTFDIMAAYIDTAAAGAVCQAALYLGGDRIQASDIWDCSTTGAKSSTPTAVSLTGGTEYAVCWASSATATLKWSTVSGALLANVINGALFDDASPAQFNANCAGAAAPYACCSGAGTGTCTGLPASLGLPQSPSANSAVLVTLSNQVF